MIKKKDLFKSPFITQISFHLLIESLENIALSNVDYRVNYAKALLEEIDSFSEFRTGIQDLSFIEKHKSLIKNLLADLFPTALTHNEIKAVAIPFSDITFNYSARFNKILNEAGVDFDMHIRDLDENLVYIMSCCLIINEHYHKKLNFTNPLFYDIPDGNGIMKHYRILYNADFLEILPTENSLQLTEDEISTLLDNFDDIDLWKEKFPQNSWILRGFGIVQLFDATVESSLSNLKTNLLKASDTKSEELHEDFQTIFRSIFEIPDLNAAVTIYDSNDKKFISPSVDKKINQSIILNQIEQVSCNEKLFDCFREQLINNKEKFIISSTDKFEANKENSGFIDYLKFQNVNSCILAPVVKNNDLLGVFELSSKMHNSLNSINANKLDLILPYLVDTLSRYKLDIQNQIEAVIQKEYTSIHSSVYWKFKKEAQRYLQNSSLKKDHTFKEIIFKDVYPLFGEIDIKGSSEHRNLTVKADLKRQLNILIEIIDGIKSKSNLLILDQRKFELNTFIEELNVSLKADTEQTIQRYVNSEIHPIIQSENTSDDVKTKIEKYFNKIDEKTGMYYHERKKFDNALTEVNKKLASILDEKQIEAQQIFPHYYERFKSDGVEHNLYIGASINPDKLFDKIYINNLRLWQLQTLCEMELEHHKMKTELSYHLEVTSLILVFSSPISIRFRMDEKRFDVDGTYNARYEVVKKRIDKAFIKGTRERITEKEKITIVYSQKNEEDEYKKYIKFLQHKDILEKEIEKFEIEDLQGVSGLKGLRVKVKNN